MNSFYTHFLLAFILLNINAIQSQYENCPKITVDIKYTINDLMGIWYEVAQYSVNSPVVNNAQKCSYLNSTYIHGNRFQVNRMHSTKTLNLQGRFLGVGIELAQGVISLHYPDAMFKRSSIMLIPVFNQELSYAIFYSCSSSLPVAWILSRDRIPRDNLFQQAYSDLERLGFSRKYIHKIDQITCTNY